MTTKGMLKNLLTVVAVFLLALIVYNITLFTKDSDMSVFAVSGVIQNTP